MTSDDCIVRWMIEERLPLTRETWIFLNWFGTPPAVLAAEEEAEVPWWLPTEDSYPVKLTDDPGEDDPAEIEVLRHGKRRRAKS
jgi:hypothetical protein